MKEDSGVLIVGEIAPLGDLKGSCVSRFDNGANGGVMVSLLLLGLVASAQQKPDTTANCIMGGACQRDITLDDYDAVCRERGRLDYRWLRMRHIEGGRLGWNRLHVNKGDKVGRVRVRSAG